MVPRMILASLALISIWSASAQAQTPIDYKELEKTTVKLFQAYNKDDAKGVFADYISALKQGQNPDQLYQILFKPNKERFGNYKSHKFIKDGSMKADEIALLVLDAQFDKKKAKVTINFGKEDGKYKVQQVTFAEE